LAPIVRRMHVLGTGDWSGKDGDADVRAA